MPSVTVDLDDLETLVMTTAALKTIEGALNARKNDPFVRQHLEFGAAHDRLASAMRGAKRAGSGTLVDWDGALDDKEIEFLRSLEDEEGGLSTLTPDQKVPNKGQAMSVADRLAAKGCVILGQRVTGILWSDNPRPLLTIDHSGFPIKITDRGREKLVKIDADKVVA
jgi:hypothetical protein